MRLGSLVHMLMHKCIFQVGHWLRDMDKDSVHCLKAFFFFFFFFLHYMGLPHPPSEGRAWRKHYTYRPDQRSDINCQTSFTTISVLLLARVISLESIRTISQTTFLLSSVWCVPNLDPKRAQIGWSIAITKWNAYSSCWNCMRSQLIAQFWNLLRMS